ncbi:tetratricopeptide repeat protein [Lignipirellula cremea]|uniref:Tetratricopeptide repeat protein n=1 Tax=Lignipirellula cremea TaxID=2528010 RepID=A0A518DZ47_9BACT|nr:hypothetical protein [Lignipirellula cremea]QDU97081.1 Tetratricopeptide repeat protein [Lignipirellula cremea]
MFSTWLPALSPLPHCAAVCLLAAGVLGGGSQGILYAADPVAAELARTTEAINQEQDAIDAKVAALIQQLGADEYATRINANNELEKLGLLAFEALYEAQSNKDLEIRSRARFLVRSILVVWSLDDDSQEVKRSLQAYGAQPPKDRRGRMDRLASLDNAEGLDALARLARYESDDLLSKQAALLAMNLIKPDSDEATLERVRGLLTSLGRSQRTGAKWLRAYAHTLVDPNASLGQWRDLCREEQDFFAKTTNESNRDILRDLLRWRSELLLSLNHREAAYEAMRDTIALINDKDEPQHQQLLEATDWFLKHEAWSVVEEVAQRFNTQFNSQPLLLYRLAEAESQQGKTEQAEATANKALGITPDEGDSHLVAAFSLQQRGLFEWAKREYRRVLDLETAGSLLDMRARRLFSEMLHDLQEDKEAGEVLVGLVEAMDADPKILQLMQQRLGLEPGAIRSRAKFFLALHQQRQGELAQVRENLLEGIREDPTDADVLIAMYRVPQGDEEFREETKKRLDAAVGKFRSQIAEFKKQAEEAPSEPIRDWANRNLATTYNQLAWLVANTEGDFDEAVRSSHRSLELRPNTASFLDTLGHCYFAVGDMENAVKYQSQAVALEPHSGQISRQLNVFQKALAEQQTQRAQEEPPAPVDPLNK